MPRTVDFEAKYIAGEVERFDQKNEMFKRVRWQPELKEVGRGYYGLVEPKDKPGYRHEDIALRNGAWYLEMGFARGVIRSGFGLYDWTDKLFQMAELPLDPPMDGKDPGYNTRMVKKAAAGFGADLVGICRLDERWVYTKGFDAYERTEFDIDIPSGFKYVINVAVAMDYELYKYTPTFVAGGATGMGYSKMALVAGLLGQFLNQLGYRSIPCGNDTAMSIPLAVQAGLGEVGRNGILVTPKYGPRVRLCKVFTDMPLVPDRAIEFGVEEFCEVCRKCSSSCPAGAIPDGDKRDEALNISNADGTRKWYVDGEKCFKFWSSKGCDCGNCVRACPFNKPDGLLHDTSRSIIEKVPVFDRLFVKADDLFGYGRQKDASTYFEKPS